MCVKYDKLLGHDRVRVICSTFSTTLFVKMCLYRCYSGVVTLALDDVKAFLNLLWLSP